MELLKLRMAEAKDIGAMLDIYGYYILNSTASFEYAVPSQEEFALRLKKLEGVFPWIVCEKEDGEILGYAYAGRYGERKGYDWSAAVSVYVRDNTHGIGVGTIMYAALFRILTALGYRKAYGIVACPNPNSEAFHEKMGFSLEGRLNNIGYKFGRPVGLSYYGKELLPVAENPLPPAPLESFSEEEIEEMLNCKE